MMGDSEAKLKWKKENTRNLVININKNTDAEIFAWLDGLGKSYGAEIKKAIKEYIVTLRSTYATMQTVDTLNISKRKTHHMTENSKTQQDTDHSKANTDHSAA